MDLRNNKWRHNWLKLNNNRPYYKIQMLVDTLTLQHQWVCQVWVCNNQVWEWEAFSNQWECQEEWEWVNLKWEAIHSNNQWDTDNHKW